MTTPPAAQKGFYSGAEPAPEAPVPTRLLNRNYLLLWQGQWVSQLGNQAFAVAVAFWTLEATGSASLMGLLLAALNLPIVVLAPIGGALADRFSRLRIVIACDVAAGLALSVQAFAMMSGRLSRDGLVALLFAVALTLGVVSGFFMPAISAMVPDLVPASRLAAANSLGQSFSQATMLIGQAVGGVLFQLFGATRLFLFDGLSFLFSAGSESLIRLPPRPAGPRLGFAASIRQFKASLREGFTYIRQTPGLLNFIVAPAAYNFFTMAVSVLLPFFVRKNLHAGAEWYGFLMATISCGSIVGFVIAGLVRLRGAARTRFLVALIALAPVPMAVAGYVHDTVLALFIGLALGVMIGLINVSLLTLLQTIVPAAMRGRVLGLWTSLVTGLMPLGMALGGFAGDLTGKNIPLVFTTCGVLTLFITFATLGRRSTRQFLASGGE